MKFAPSLESNFVHAISAQGLDILSWQGRALCSSRDPQREAQKWAEMVKASAAERVIVLGLGVGHHVDYLASLCPQMLIHVFELHEPLINRYRAKKANNVILHDQINADAMYFKFDMVCDFLPAQQGLEKDYHFLRQHLMGLEISEDLAQKNIKQICALYKDQTSREAKMWLAMRELVK